MYYSKIKYNDISNGTGIRTSLFVSGCTHHCKNCFNPETWDFYNGDYFDNNIQMEIISSLSKPYVKGLSILGGDPLEINNQKDLVDFIRKVKALFPTKDIWLWTGYTYDVDIPHCGITEELLSYIDVIIDGEFIESLKKPNLRFRGSTNQRIIELKDMRNE